MPQDPQAYVDDQGNEYVREGNRWRVIRSGQQAGPAAPTSVPGLIPMETPADRRAEEDRAYRRERDAVVDTRAERQLAITEQSAGLRGNPYQKKFDEARATRDANRFDEALSGRMEAAGLEAGGRRAERILQDDAPVGAFADQRIAAGRVAGDWLGWLPGIPTREETQQLEQLRLIGSQGALGDVSQLKGPLSEKELAFIQRLQIDPNATRETNLQVARAMQWAARRQDAYGESMEQWVMQYGSPSAPNERGQSFGSWWSDHAAQNLPFPDGSQAQAAPAGVQGIRPGQGVPADIASRFGEDGQVSTEEMIAAGWTPDYENGQWLPPGGSPGDAPPPPTGPQGGPSEGYDDTRERVAGERSDAGEGFFRKGDAFTRGMADMLTFGLSDEIAAGLDTVVPLNGGRAGWVDGFPDAYRHNLARERGAMDADARDVPVSRGSGQVAGGLMFAPRAIAGAAGKTLLTRSAQGAGVGAAYGGAYGFGSAEGGALERAPSAVRGAGVGAVAGGAAPGIINVGGRVVTPIANALSDGARVVARPIVNALGDRAPVALQNAVAPNPLARGLERFAGTNRPNVNALNTSRAKLEGAVGRPVAAASVVNTGGRAMLRGVATRSDDAREIAENFGQGTAEALPSRVGQQARRILSNDTRSPDDIKAALDRERGRAAREDYAGPYAQPVQIEADLAGALSGGPGRAAIQRARAAAEAWQDTAVMAELDALEAAARAGQPLPQVSAGAVDRIRQAMSGRGEKLAQNPATRAVGAGLQNRAGQVDEALENVEGLAPARAAYRDTSRQMGAVDAGERFMGNTPDDVAAAMRGAPESAQAPFRAAAARSIERAAGTTGAAPGVANRLAIGGTPQRQMMDETLGPDTAQTLSTAMRGERDIYRGALQVDPGVGSQTTNNSLKAAEAAGGMVADVAGGRPLGVVRRVIGMLDSRGFNAQEAEAVLRAMTDPRRTDEVIGILSERMSRREARSLTRALRYQLTIAPQSGQQN